MNIMFSRFWNRPHSDSFEGMRCCGVPSGIDPPLSKDSCEKLEDVECFSIGVGAERAFFGAVGFVEQCFGAGSPMDAGEADGTTK